MSHGILPLAKSSFKEHVWVSPFLDQNRWCLPGHGEAYADCGSWRWKGCLNVFEHNQAGLLEDMAGKVFIKVFRRSCLRAECPVCYEKWAGKEAHKIAYRLEAFKGGGRPIHLVVSPPQSLWGLEPSELRKKAYKIAKNCRFIGGSCIFHPFRSDKEDWGLEETPLSGRWYFSPHFHMIGYGWIKGTKENFEASGWVVKNVGVRESVEATAQYQLSHAGVHEKHHTVTWFGFLAYNKLWVPPRENSGEACPICGEKLRPVIYFGAKDLPEEEGVFWLEPEGWQYARRWGYG